MSRAVLRGRGVLPAPEHFCGAGPHLYISIGVFTVEILQMAEEGLSVERCTLPLSTDQTIMHLLNPKIKQKYLLTFKV